MRQLLVGAIVSAGLFSAAGAAELTYTPVNPSFGGNPLNSSHLLGIASAQRTATASDAPVESSLTGLDGDNTTDYADLFISQLQGRLLSALASQVTEAIFGDNPQDSGTVTFGDTDISFTNDGTSINLVITDFTTGTVTEIDVPLLVTQ